MPSIIHDLKEIEEDHKLLHSVSRSIFLDGECYAFAIALHQGLGWPLVGLMKGDEIWHAGVRSPDGRIHDVRGLLTEAEFGNHFMPEPHVIRDIQMKQLHARRPISEHSIMRARRAAEALWPELPWIESATAKLRAFADELEQLSRKHGLWISGPVPAQLPLLYREDGGEGGYELSPAIPGMTHTINRHFLKP